MKRDYNLKLDGIQRSIQTYPYNRISIIGQQQTAVQAHGAYRQPRLVASVEYSKFDFQPQTFSLKHDFHCFLQSFHATVGEKNLHWVVAITFHVLSYS
jgi:hypothetical protein